MLIAVSYCTAWPSSSTTTVDKDEVVFGSDGNQNSISKIILKFGYI